MVKGTVSEHTQRATLGIAITAKEGRLKTQLATFESSPAQHVGL